MAVVEDGWENIALVLCVTHDELVLTAVYVFDRDIMEAMLREEQDRIKTELEVFAEKLKHHGVG